MAIKEIKREWSPCQLDYVKTFLLHSEKDVKDLPKCCVGSKATVSETDNEYYCTADGWKLGSELGGGGSSEVVILPETEFEIASQGQPAYIREPLSATPTNGATAKVSYNGTEYMCWIAHVEDGGTTAFAIGNFDAMGLPVPGGNPTAPFVAVLYEAEENGAYGMIVSLEDVSTVTLSIVQVGAASGGGSASAGGGLFNVNCDLMGKFPTEDPEKPGWFNVEGVTFDKTYDEIVAAVKSGAFAVVDAVNFMNQSNMLFRMPFVSYTADNAEFVVRAAGVDLLASVHADGSASFKFYSTDL